MRHPSNLQQLLNVIRLCGQCSRVELSRLTGTSLPRVGELVKELITQGVLIEEGFDKSAGGRRAALLKPNPRYAVAAGVELSTRAARGILLDFAGKRVAEASGPAPSDFAQDEMVELLLGVVGDLLAQDVEGLVRGIGVGISGMVDSDGNTSIEFPHAELWSPIRLGDTLREHFGKQAFIQNDVHAATLGEIRYGDHKEESDLLYLHVGRGIGLGVVAGGRLHLGAHNKAGELGHVTVSQNGPICYCGNYGCLESLASPYALVAQARDALGKGVRSTLADHFRDNGGQIEIEAIFRAAREGDRLACNLVEEAGYYIGACLAGFVNVLNPSVLIFGGVLAEGECPLREPIERSFRSKALPATRDYVTIAVSALKQHACAVGAATLVFEDMFGNPEKLFWKKLEA